MKKRVALLLLMFIVLLLPLFSATLDEVMEAAKNNSPSYRNTELSYQNGLLNIRQMERNKTPSITVSATYNPITKGSLTDGSAGEAKDWGMSLTPSVSYVTYDQEFGVDGGLTYQMNYDGSGVTITPRAGIDWAKDLNGYEPETMEDLNLELSKLNTEYSYRSAVISFEKNVLSTIRTLYSAEKSMATTRSAIDDLETNLSNIDKLGTVTKDSNTYKNLELSLTRSKQSLELLEKQYEDAKANYKVFTGLDWDGIEEIPIPDPKMPEDAGEGTSVTLARLNLKLAEETYAQTEATYNPQGITVGADVTGTWNRDGGVKQYYDYNGTQVPTGSLPYGNLGLSSTVGYTGKNWSISASPSATWTFSDTTTFSPGITIAGRWTNNTRGVYENAELSKKQNDITTRQNQLVNAITERTQNTQNLVTQIMNWNYSWGQWQANRKYLEDVYENEKELYERGLSTKDDLDEAEEDLLMTLYEGDDIKLQGLILEKDIELYEL